MNSDMHKRLTGVENKIILDNALYLAKNGAALQIRVPIIPGMTDTEDNLRQTAEFCAQLGDAVKLVQILPYHAVGKMKYERIGQEYNLPNLTPPEDEFISETLILFKSYGLNTQLN